MKTRTRRTLFCAAWLTAMTAAWTAPVTAIPAAHWIIVNAALRVISVWLFIGATFASTE